MFELQRCRRSVLGAEKMVGYVDRRADQRITRHQWRREAYDAMRRADD